MALDVHHGTRTEWDSYDILSKDGIKIEVKSSGYIQTWTQKDYSNLNFGIRTTKEWKQEDSTYSELSKRQSDVYVFCVHNHKDQNTINPLDLSQWYFSVLNTKILNNNLANQKSIGLSGILKLGAVQTDYAGLNNTIHKVYEKFNSNKSKRDELGTMYEKLTAYLSHRQITEKDIILYPDLSSRGSIFFTTPLLEKIFPTKIEIKERWKGGRSIFYWIENHNSSIKLRCEMCSDGLSPEELGKHKKFSDLITGQSNTNWNKFQRLITWDVFSFKNIQWFDIKEEDLENFQNQIIDNIKNIINTNIKLFESDISIDQFL